MLDFLTRSGTYGALKTYAQNEFQKTMQKVQQNDAHQQAEICLAPPVPDDDFYQNWHVLLSAQVGTTVLYRLPSGTALSDKADEKKCALKPSFFKKIKACIHRKYIRIRANFCRQGQKFAGILSYGRIFNAVCNKFAEHLKIDAYEHEL